MSIEITEEERDSVRESLRALEYWFNTDQEILDAMHEDDLAVHIRLHSKILSALNIVDSWYQK
jgi:hypothetical protein